MRKALALAVSLFLSAQVGAQTAPNRTGIYSNPAESGYGLFVVQAGNRLIPAWYTYDTDGKPLWFLVSGADLQSDGSYRGDLFRYTGAPFSQTVPDAVNSTNQVGTARLRFTTADTVEFQYTIGTQTQTKTVSRFNLVSNAPLTCTPTTAPRTTATNYTDLWWNPQQRGWGLNIVHQGDVIFFGWYTYGPDQRPMWISGTGQRQPNGSFAGDLNRPVSGTPWSQINGSPATSFPVPKVGTFTLSFSDGANAAFNWTLDGITQSRTLTRFEFGSPATVCSSASGGSSGGTFTTNQCGRIYRVGDEWTYRYGDGRQERSRVIADGTFNGQPVRIVEGYDSQNRLISKSYYRILPSAMATVASESFDAASGAITSRIVFTPAIEVPVTLTTGQTLTLSYRGDGTTFGAQASTATYNYQQQIRILGRENVTVPAGSFAQACDMEVTTTGNAVVAGFSVPIPPTTARAFVTDAAPNGIKGTAGTGVGNATFEMQSFRNGN